MLSSNQIHNLILCHLANLESIISAITFKSVIQFYIINNYSEYQNNKVWVFQNFILYYYYKHSRNDW